MRGSEYHLIAEVRSTHNTKGYLNLISYSDLSGQIEDTEVLFIDVFGDKRKFFVEDFYFTGEKPIIKFKNFDSINDVEFLTGKKIYLCLENAGETNSETFIIGDLIDSDVYYGKKFFGKLRDVENYPGNDVLVIQKSDDAEILIPLVKDFVDKIDSEKKKIYLNGDVDLEDDAI